MGNRIPREFNKIIVEVLVDTNVDKKGDVIHVTKDDYNNYRALNTRTNKYSQISLSTLRNEIFFEILDIEQV